MALQRCKPDEKAIATAGDEKAASEQMVVSEMAADPAKLSVSKSSLLWFLGLAWNRVTTLLFQNQNYKFFLFEVLEKLGNSREFGNGI